MNTTFNDKILEKTARGDLEVTPLSDRNDFARAATIFADNAEKGIREEYYLVRVVENQNQKPATASASAPTPPPFKKAAPADPRFLAENADLLMKNGEVELARNIFRALLRTGEANDVAYAGLAGCADREGLIEQAIQFAWDSVAFSPNQKGYQILSQLLVQTGRDQEAAAALTRAIKLLNLSSDQQAYYYGVIGNCYARLGQNTEAEEALKASLALDPSGDEIQSNLGSLYLEQGQIYNAKRSYQDALAANTGNDKAWVGLGLCFVTEGDKAQAHDAFAKALDINLRNSTAIFHLVKCAYEIKKYASAERILAAYVETAPVSPSLLYSLAGLHYHVGKKAEAVALAKRILQMKPEHVGSKDLIARIEAEKQAEALGRESSQPNA